METNLQIYDSVVHNRKQLAAFHAHQYAIRTQQELIYYTMKMDEEFLGCMEKEMRKSFTGSKPHSLPFLFFAAEVCQRSDGRDFGIFFPRLEDYLAHWREDPMYGQAKIDARVEEKAKEKSSNAFQTLPAPPPPSHGLSKMMLRLASTAHHWAKMVPWAKVEAQFEARLKTEPKALLLEDHY
ncbi:MAG: hypothetical protein M1826_006262 [Phylliscum demangeonii]|nr:MAG: hypothetical protein M1826_006262 [Phylliscum demangeonii]